MHTYTQTYMHTHTHIHTQWDTPLQTEVEALCVTSRDIGSAPEEVGSE